jgi:hypothetical protein
MRISVIGAGAIGSAVGKLWARAGHELFFSSRHLERLGAVVAAAGPRARMGTVQEAAAFAEVVLLAIYYQTIDEALAAAGDFKGKVVIDPINAYLRDKAGNWTALAGVSVAAALAGKLPGARLVKAYNTLPAATLEQDHHRGEPYVVACSGDDLAARRTVTRLIEESGFAPLDLGDSTQVRHQEQGGCLYGEVLTMEQARARLTAAQITLG